MHWSADPLAGFLPVNSRRAIRFHVAGVQLRLPLYLLGASAGFGALLAWNANAAFADLYGMLISAAPRSFSGQIAEQMRAFLLVSAILAVGWVVVVLAICTAYTHRLIGPTVALRRQVQALKRGDTTGHVRIRGHDPVFQGLAEELNELARRLAAERIAPRRPPAARRETPRGVRPAVQG